jgi:hypothetical protein
LKKYEVIMSGLEPIRFNKNWNEGTNTREVNWDEIANKVAPFAVQTNNNFKQLGLDLNGVDYTFNGVGRATQTTSVISRLSTLEASSAILGTRNIGLDLADQSKVAIFGSDGTAFSSTNVGIVTFNESSTAGHAVSREISAAQSLTLTGCHWGQGALGDLTDHILWIGFLDTGTSAILFVAARGGMQSIDPSVIKTVANTVTDNSYVYATSLPATELNATYLGWVKANFDDTGNAGGEDYWTIQNSYGDVGLGSVGTRFYGTVEF